MTQKIKVQDGNIIYAATDPSYGLNFGINGILSVSEELFVGDQSSTPGVITTVTGQNLTLATGTNGNLILQPSGTGSVIINGLQWPNGSLSVTQGSYLGASALNTLQFYSFILAFNSSDTLTVTELNTLYPTIQPGQCVVGPTVVYYCIGASQWRILQPNLGYIPVNNAGSGQNGTPSAMTGELLLYGNPLNNLGAVPKQYVDSISSGINIHAACVTSTTPSSNLTSNYYTNGVSGSPPDAGAGVGATLTASANVNINDAGVGGFSTLIVGSRILVNNQATTQQNGIYVVTDLGVDGTSPWVLTRASDYDNSTYGDAKAGDLVYISSGALGGTQWAENSTGTQEPGNILNIGTDPITFTQFAGASTYTAGPGITIASSVISNSGVLSNFAGTGISVSSATGNVTLTNTGVISLMAGSNISVTGETGNITVSVTDTVPSANTSNNLAGGTTGSVPFQTSAGTTTFLAPGTNGYVLTLVSGEPSWQQSSGGVTSLSGTANQVIVSSATGAITLSLPQNIETGAAPEFSGINFTTIPNNALINDSVTVGSTDIVLGSTYTSIAGLSTLGASAIAMSSAGITTTTYTSSTTTTNQIIDSVAITSIRTVKYLYQVTSGTSYQAGEILIIQDGSNSWITEYANINTGTVLATFNATVAGGNLNLVFTPVNAVTTVNVVRTSINI